MTAYVLIAFLEDRVSNHFELDNFYADIIFPIFTGNIIFQSKMAMYQNVINKAIDYVIRNLEGNDDLYSLAVASYAVQLANLNSKSYILQTFDVKAIRKGDLQVILH